MKEIGAVVLNYKNYLETEKCVNSLLGQKGIQIHIVIVDNGSGNESCSYLSEKFCNAGNVEVIALKTNLGYAKGNNVGIRHLLGKKVKDILICNSDVQFVSDKTVMQLAEEYEEGVAVILPIITNPNGELDQRVMYPQKYLYLRIMKHVLTRLLNLGSPRAGQKKEKYIKESGRISGLQENNYVISGSAFLLTKDYFKVYHGLFPRTFLYYEEWATILLIHKAGLKCKIAESDSIIHLGGASTPDEIKNMSKQSKKLRDESRLKILGLLFTPAFIAKRIY